MEAVALPAVIVSAGITVTAIFLFMLACPVAGVAIVIRARIVVGAVFWNIKTHPVDALIMRARVPVIASPSAIIALAVDAAVNRAGVVVIADNGNVNTAPVYARIPCAGVAIITFALLIHAGAIRLAYINGTWVAVITVTQRVVA
jgi:hypothetical protein